MVPRGHPQCLTGKTFVITGVQESLERADIEDLIKRHNGRVTGSVSGKTTFLIVGTDCGSSKTRAVSVPCTSPFPTHPYGLPLLPDLRQQDVNGEKGTL